MKNLTRLILISGFLMLCSTLFAQVPPPHGSNGDYCACVPGIQAQSFPCPSPCPPSDDDDDGNTGNTGNTGNNGSTGPTETGSGTTGTGPTGNFPNVFAWLECFYDPDCD